MHVDDLVLVSVDDHVVEPPNLFDDWLPSRFRDEAPNVVRKDDGTDVWRFGRAEIPNIGLNAVAGRPPEEYAIDPTSFDDLRTGCYDVDDRVRDMDANGALGSMCFPSFPQFCGQLFARHPDKELALALVRAYNDWHIEAWCGSHPGRFIPLSIPPLWDPELMAAEVRRVAEKGCHAVSFSENPSKLGHPSIHTGHWDPFFAACEEAGTVVAMHIGSSSSLVVTSPDAPMDVLVTLTPVNSMQAAADLVWSPVLKHFRKLRVALSEGGIGWIPYFLERIDYVYDRHRSWTGQDLGDRLPSEAFREQVVTCFIDDPIGVELRDRVGLDMMTWECDYPHSDSSWPHSPERLMEQVAGVPDDDIDKITHLNAMRIFGYDPFSVLPRDQCTVGALRARAAGWDVSPRPRGITPVATRASDLAQLATSRPTRSTTATG